MKSFGPKVDPITPRRHQKNVLESKHEILRPIFLRQKAADASVCKRVHIETAFDVSNQLYGFDVTSAYELSHIFTNPLNIYPTLLSDDLYKAHEMLAVKCKLARILRSKSPNHVVIAPGTMWKSL